MDQTRTPSTHSRPRLRPDRPRRGVGARAGVGVGVAVLALTAGLASAGGAGENLLLIIDPSDAASMYLGNYYRHARNLPESNVLYLSPGASNYASFVSNNLAAVSGHLSRRGTLSVVDYVFVAPSPVFFVEAPGLVSDGCFAVNRFGLTGAYASAFVSSQILAGTSSTLTNQYSSTNVAAVRAFDSEIAWLGGLPSEQATARRYYLAGMIGKTGQNGNTPGEIVAMIDRSVAADGTRPAGTYYFMDNTSDAARNVRASSYNAIITSINNLNIPGVTGLRLSGLLPGNRDDCLGVMSGFAGANVQGTPFTLVPGAFADHLTSWACAFDIDSQTKASEWIRKGASGTAGAIEEPCNYPGKFPGARLHAFYAQGMTLGESWFRSAGYFPFQHLFVGDPLTRPFAYIPVVSVPDAPGGPVSGSITLTPSATTARPNGRMLRFDLLIDGRPAGTAEPGQTFTLDTNTLTDGWHEARVVAVDRTLVETTGAWVGSIVVENGGRSVGIAPDRTSGDLGTVFGFGVSPAGGAVREVRLVSGGRVVAAAASPGTLVITGQSVGAGPVTVRAEAVFDDGAVVSSPPVSLSIAFDPGSRVAGAPTAFSFTRPVVEGGEFTVELPASWSGDPSLMTFEVVSPPTKATLAPGARGYRVATPIGTPKGVDTFTFRAVSPDGSSNTATVTLVFPCPADFNGDGFLDFFDLDAYIACFEGDACPGGRDADFNADGFVDFFDLDAYIEEFEAGC
ncbi:MAG: TIGR03790 family protein [Phycisphaeraceae bacterium]|nr:MAG: TIGR03790 family protein [Phycisphaeraceae bacterium]